MPSSIGDPWEDEGFGAEDEWEGKESVEDELDDEDEDELEPPEEDDGLGDDDEDE